MTGIFSRLVMESLDAEVDTGTPETAQNEELASAEDTEVLLDTTEQQADTDVIEAQAESIESDQAEVDNYEEAEQVLEGLQAFVKQTLARPNPGLTPMESALVTERFYGVLRQIHTPISINQFPAMESYTTTAQSNTVWILEGIGDTLKGIGKAVIEFLKSLWQKTVAFFKSFFDSFKKDKAKAEEIQKRLTELKKDNKLGTPASDVKIKSLEMAAAIAEYSDAEMKGGYAQKAVHLRSKLSILVKNWKFQETVDIMEDISKAAGTMSRKDGDEAGWKSMNKEDVSKVMERVQKLMENNKLSESVSTIKTDGRTTTVSKTTMAELIKTGEKQGSETVNETENFGAALAALPFGYTLKQAMKTISLNDTTGDKMDRTVLVVPGNISLIRSTNDEKTYQSIVNSEDKQKLVPWDADEAERNLAEIIRLCEQAIDVEKKQKEISGTVDKIMNLVRKEENRKTNFFARAFGANAMSVSTEMLKVAKRFSTVGIVFAGASINEMQKAKSKADKDEKDKKEDDKK